ncbi:pectin lyase-like protein [Ascodesmis nigricans]|uniref:pectate lyase n=1 Tax=Ascodesmis nigricans TaxID=341454 RepID=A0A4S2N062_9PEZI|nr:pectin lyase-like protein [Ascodesmis nigricans]
MKTTFFSFALVGLLQFASAGLIKRQSASQPADVGYATLNGGGAGGPTVTVSSLTALQSAASGDLATIILVSGKISGAAVVKVGSNKSIIGKSGAVLEGVGLRVSKKNNVIIRNLKISKVLASTGDAIGIDYAKNVWVDHVELSSDMSHSKDYYDGLLDITHGSDYVTVSNSYLHDHWKSSLVGHSDNNSGEDKGHLTVSYVNNYWKNLNSRAPSYRFGTGHILNNYFENVSDGVNIRQNAKLLIEGNVWSGGKKAIYTTDGGSATLRNNEYGGASVSVPSASVSVPYQYTALAVGSTKSHVQANAGAKLNF